MAEACEVAGDSRDVEKHEELAEEACAAVLEALTEGAFATGIGAGPGEDVTEEEESAGG